MRLSILMITFLVVAVLAIVIAPRVADAIEIWLVTFAFLGPDAAWTFAWSSLWVPR